MFQSFNLCVHNPQTWILLFLIQVMVWTTEICAQIKEIILNLRQSVVEFTVTMETGYANAGIQFVRGAVRGNTQRTLWQTGAIAQSGFSGVACSCIDFVQCNQDSLSHGVKENIREDQDDGEKLRKETQSHEFVSVFSIEWSAAGKSANSNRKYDCDDDDRQYDERKERFQWDVPVLFPISDWMTGRCLLTLRVL